MKSDVEDKHYNYMCCDACLKVANFKEKYQPDTLFHCCEGKEAKGTWRKVKDIIKEKDQEIADLKIRDTERLELLIQKNEEITRLNSQVEDLKKWIRAGNVK